MKGKCVLTALRVLNWQTYHAHYATNFSIRKVLHIIIKCTYLNKKKIPTSQNVISTQTVPLILFWMIHNSPNILSYVTVMSANKCAAW
jgi:hypothetical protein